MTDRDDGPISDEEIGKLWARYWTPYSKGRIDVALPRFTRALLRREGERLVAGLIAGGHTNCENRSDRWEFCQARHSVEAIRRMLGVEEKP